MKQFKIFAVFLLFLYDSESVKIKGIFSIDSYLLQGVKHSGSGYILLYNTKGGICHYSAKFNSNYFKVTLPSNENTFPMDTIPESFSYGRSSSETPTNKTQYVTFSVNCTSRDNEKSSFEKTFAIYANRDDIENIYEFQAKLIYPLNLIYDKLRHVYSTIDIQVLSGSAMCQIIAGLPPYKVEGSFEELKYLNRGNGMGLYAPMTENVTLEDYPFVLSCFDKKSNISLKHMVNTTYNEDKTNSNRAVLVFFNFENNYSTAYFIFSYPHQDHCSPEYFDPGNHIKHYYSLSANRQNGFHVLEADSSTPENYKIDFKMNCSDEENNIQLFTQPFYFHPSPTTSGGILQLPFPQFILISFNIMLFIWIR